MNKFFLLGLSLCSFLNLAHATSELKVHVISPPAPLDWSSPQTLLKTTLANSTKSTLEISGHMIIEISTDEPNPYHVTHLITAMGSKHPWTVTGTELSQGLGLSALYALYPGKLNSATESLRQLKTAKKEGRLATLQVRLSSSDLQNSLDFLNRWIQHGSFRHYGGGHLVGNGYGAGCADFAVYFLNIALHGKAPLTEWMREVYLPYDLLKYDRPDGTVSPVSVFKILHSTEPWGNSSHTGKYFTIPDPELVFGWIKKRSPATESLFLESSEIDPVEISPSADAVSAAKFEANDPPEAPARIEKVWASIKTSRTR